MPECPDWTPKQRGQETRIWRYLDLHKFLYLIKHEELRFSAFDELSDPYEGRPTDEKIESIKQEIIKETDHRESLAQREAEALGKFTTDDTWGVSCWCKHRSKPLWDLFTSNEAGIAIESTIGNVENSLELPARDLHHGEVEYEFNDDLRRADDQLADVFHKPRSYISEDEYRFALQENSNKYIPCDINILIDKIYVHPESKGWIVNLVKDLVDDLTESPNLKSRVSRSPILENPYE